LSAVKNKKNDREHPGLVHVRYEVGRGAYSLALITFEQEERESSQYEEKLEQVIQDLNEMGYGCIREIPCDRLSRQTDGLILYLPKIAKCKPVVERGTKTFGECTYKEKHIPLDIRYLGRIHSHIRNPTILVLRRVFSSLTVDHRGIVTKLVEMDVRQKKIELTGIDFHREVDELERYTRSLALSAKNDRLKSRKLDRLVKGIKAINAQKRDYVFLLDIVRDPYHKRRFDVEAWQEQRNVTSAFALTKQIEKAEVRLDRLLDSVMQQMSEIAGFRFADLPDIHDTTFTWYTLGLEVPRGEYFSTSFSREKKTELALQRRSHHFIRSLYDVSNFEKKYDAWEPSQGNYREYVPECAGLFLGLHKAISASIQEDGEVLQSIEIGEETGITKPAEYLEAKAWTKKNHIALLALEKRLADRLKKALNDWPDLQLPDDVMSLLEEDGPVNRAMVARFQRERNNLAELRNDLASLQRETEQELRLVTGHIDLDMALEEDPWQGEPLLVRLVRLYKKVTERKDFWNLVDHQKLNSREDRVSKHADKSFQRVLAFEDEMDGIRMRCEQLIAEVYEHIPYCVRFPELEGRGDLVPENSIWVDRATHREAFEIVLLDRLRALRQLEYKPFDPEHYRLRFEAAKSMGQVDSLFMIDRIFHEIRCLPSADQLLEALQEWVKNLSEPEMKKYQEQIVENNDQLSDLLEEVRVYLRDQLQRTDKLWPRRLRLEVFGLGDFFADNLRELFWSQERMMARIATPSELGLLLKSIDAIETQIFEAQKWTRDGGRADLKLAQLRRAGLFSDEFLATLEEDLRYNKRALKGLLVEISDRMKDIRAIKQRFDQNTDDAHLELIIEYGDITRLQGIYEFLEGLGPRHLKEFAHHYKQKMEAMDNLISGRDEAVSILPETVREKITQQIRDQYFRNDNRYLPHLLRLEILDNANDALKADCRQLALTLNFVKFGRVHKKAAYQIPLTMLAEAKKLNLGDERRRMARRYWAKVRNALDDHKPEAFFGNYENNKVAFFKDKDELIGDTL